MKKNDVFKIIDHQIIHMNILPIELLYKYIYIYIYMYKELSIYFFIIIYNLFLIYYIKKSNCILETCILIYLFYLIFIILFVFY